MALGRIPSVSTIALLAPITATINGATYNPTGDTVTAAVAAAGTAPAGLQFQTAAWEQNTQNVALMIGPGTTVGQLAVGQYDFYVKITDNPETPVLYVGSFEIY